MVIVSQTFRTVKDCIQKGSRRECREGNERVIIDVDQEEIAYCCLITH